jgi:hypothetical protein
MPPPPSPNTLVRPLGAPVRCTGPLTPGAAALAIPSPRLSWAFRLAKSGLVVYDLGDDSLAPWFSVLFPHMLEMFLRSRCFFAQCCVHWCVGPTLLSLPALPVLLRCRPHGRGDCRRQGCVGKGTHIEQRRFHAAQLHGQIRVSTIVEIPVTLVWVPIERVPSSPWWLVVRILLQRHWLGPAVPCQISNRRGGMGKEGVVRVTGPAWLCARALGLLCSEAGFHG